MTHEPFTIEPATHPSWMAAMCKFLGVTLLAYLLALLVMLALLAPMVAHAAAPGKRIAASPDALFGLLR